MWGRYWDSGGEPPFWPWIQLVREGLRSSFLAIPADLSVLAHLVPELGSPPDVAQPRNVLPVAEALSKPSQRFLLYDAVSTLFKRITAAGPLMMVLDDLHAADEDSLLLLRFLSRDLKQAPILLIATYRDADLRRSSKRVSLLADVSREGTTVPLAGLREDEIAQFVEHDPILRTDSSIVGWLHHVSGGNPFFLCEIARLLAGAPYKAPLNIQAAAVPDTVRDAIWRRTSAFKEETKALLKICSLLGQEFELPLLKEVSGLPSDQIITSLDEAVANSLIFEVGGSFGRYGFTHAITADALRRDLGASARLRLHHRIAAAIEVVYSDDIDHHLAELAHHYINALPLGSVDEAVKFARRGAQRARNQLAFAEASPLYAMALRALTGQPRNEIQRYELLLSIGEAQAQGRSLNEARQSFEQAIAIARTLGQADLLAKAVLAAGIWFDSYFKTDSGIISMLSEALDVLEEDDSAVRVALMARLAAEYYWSGDRRRGLELCDRSVAAARRIGDPQSLVAALWVKNQITWGPDNLDQRLARTTEIASLAESIGDYQHALRAHEMRFAALFEKGDMDAVESEMRAYRLLAEKSGEQFGIVERFQAALALFRGEFTEAELRSKELMRHAERRQDPALLVCARMLKEAIAIERAQIDPAEMEAVRKERITHFPTMSVGWRAS
jgi:tetratricopeptide (TPR) repeat protein